MNKKLGIIGGFGAYATLHFYQRILEEFASETERDYPHIIMDNNFTMPSRTRALLCEEGYEEIVKGIAASMKLMLEQQADWIVLVCGTAHYFLEDIYAMIPQARGRVVDIISVLGEELEKRGEDELLVIAAEGALLKQLYSKRLEKYGISCISPKKECYAEIRFFIESVKRNQVDMSVCRRFEAFLKQYKVKNVILGCTEFPILVQCISEMNMTREEKEEWEMYHFFDPLEMTIVRLKQILI